MPHFYLQRPDGTYSDFAKYSDTPVSRPEGTWIEGKPDGLEPYVELSLNQQLEAAFLQILPTHLGQPYLTDTVIAAIMQSKVAVIDANNIDPTGVLAKAIIRGIALPTEMDADRTSLLALIPD